MKVIITFPRAGSHLAARILGVEPVECQNEKTGAPVPAYQVIENIKKKGNAWIHYPYDEKLLDFLIMSRASLYMTVRDPRDIIVSTAHFCEKYPQTFMNWVIDGKHFVDYSVQERIDYLIPMLKDRLFDYDRWRQTGLFQIVKYTDSLKHEVAQTYKNWKRVGAPVNYPNEMTPEQIKKANEVYVDLIGAWQ